MQEYIKNKIHKNYVLKFRKINISSIIWILISLKIFSLDVSRNIIDYLIFGLTCIVVIFSISKVINKESLPIIILFIILILLQIIGLFQLSTFFSFTNIISTICVCFFILSISESNISIQSEYMHFIFLISLIRMVITASNGNINLGNTLPGCTVFFSYAYLVSIFMNKNKHHMGKYFILYIIINMISIYICLKSNSRTALFIIPIISIFFIFYIFIWKERSTLPIFFTLLCALIIIIVLYSNIHKFSWYDKLNVWSSSIFGKNLDSSRVNLWLTSIRELEWWQFIIGSGTGRLPSIARYDTSSFHNSYLQLLMQNGILGLICLVLIFYNIWKKLDKYSYDLVIKLVLSIFSGIMIYNCFESTLLQNKIFIGIIEWFILCCGIIRVKQLDLIENYKINRLK